MEKILPGPLSNKDHISIFDDIAADRMEKIQDELNLFIVYLIDQVPASFLPILAKQFDILGFKGYNFATTEAQKRTILKNYIELHRYKGTIYALEKVFSDLGYPLVQIVERPAEFSGSYPANQFPYTFKVVLNASQYPNTSAIDFSILKAVVQEYKNARSTLVPNNTITLQIDFGPEQYDDIEETVSIATEQFGVTSGVQFDNTEVYPTALTETLFRTCVMQPTMEAEAINYMNVTLLDPCVYAAAINKMVVDLKSNGIWAQIDKIYPLTSDGIGASRAFQATIDLKNANPSTAVSRLALTADPNYNFFGRGYSKIGSVEDTFINVGTNVHISMELSNVATIPNTASQNVSNFGSPQIRSAAVGGLYDAFQIWVPQSASDTRVRPTLYDNSNIVVNSEIVTGPVGTQVGGLFSLNSNLSNPLGSRHQIFINGSYVSGRSATQDTLAPISIAFTGTGSVYGAASIRFLLIGKTLTLAQIASLNSIINTYANKIPN